LSYGTAIEQDLSSYSTIGQRQKTLTNTKQDIKQHQNTTALGLNFNPDTKGRNKF
jgi:hypothetical protein